MASVKTSTDTTERLDSSSSNDWFTEFHTAVEFKDETAVEEILKIGVDIEAPNNRSVTALMTAVEREHKPIIKLLLEYGADITASYIRPCRNKKLRLNSTILHYAVRSIVDESIIIMLLTVKPNFEPASREVFNRIVNHAVQRENSRLLKYLYRDIDVSKLDSSIKKLISVETRPDIDIQDPHNYSPLLLAIMKKRIQIVKWLLENGASLHRVDQYHHKGSQPYQSCTMLHMAALWYDKNQDEELVRSLVHYGEDIDATTLSNSTALHIAVHYNKVELVKILVSLGADMNKASSESIGTIPLTPLNASLYQTNLEIFKYFAGTNKITLENLQFLASILLYLPGELKYKAEVLLQLCLRDGYKCPKNESLTLHLAIMVNNQEVIDSFVNHNYPNISRMKWDGLYPIHQATKSNNINCITRLLDLGANIDIKDEKLGRTALYYAVTNLHTPIILILLNKGADISALNNIVSHQSLEFLIRMRQSIIIERLLDTSSDIYHFYPPHPDRYFADIMIKHIIKSKVANIFFDPYSLCWQQFCSENTTEEFSNDCVEEIEMLKKTVICGTSYLSYHHFLTNNVRQLAIYTRNVDITANFKPHLLKNRFPIYGQMIITSYLRALNHMKLILNFETVLADILCHFPMNFVRNIPDYLSIDDLNVLLDY